MITHPPLATRALDVSLTYRQLNAALYRWRTFIRKSSRWRIRETYVDNGWRDAFYGLRIRPLDEAPGDDLQDETLLRTALPGVRFLRRTRLGSEFPLSDGRVCCREEGVYWKPISRERLVYRLERFLYMHKHGIIHPPGYKYDHYPHLSARRHMHDRLGCKRFGYEIESPWGVLSGMGPESMRGHFSTGALQGQLVLAGGQPAAHYPIEVRDKRGRCVFQTCSDGDGRFWASQLPPGLLTLSVKERQIQLTKADYRPFNAMQGLVSTNQARPPQITLTAPDSTAYHAKPDETGFFQTEPVPTLPYRLSVADQTPFQVRKRGRVFPVGEFLDATHALADAAGESVYGVVKNGQNVPLEGVKVYLLNAKRQRIASTNTGYRGVYAFLNLKPGRYTIRLAGRHFLPSVTPIPIAEKIPLPCGEHCKRHWRSRNQADWQTTDIP